MDTPHEPQRGRIISFPQAHAPDRPVAASGQASALNDDDRLIDQSPSRNPQTGPAPISHLRGLPLGISSGALYPHLATEDVPHHAASLGVQTVELMLQTPGEYQPDYIADIANRVRDAGVKVRSVHTMLNLHPMFDPYPRRAREGRQLFDLGIRAAAALDADVLVWHGARAEEVAQPDGWERFVRLSTRLAAACGEAGVKLGVENVSWCALATVRDIVRFATRIDEIGPPEHIGFVFDPFQAMRADANPFMILAAMGNRVANVHISDYSGEHPEQCHLPPGEGHMPWSALLRAIAGSGYSGPMIVEAPLGTGSSTLDRVRDYIEPRIRSVFDFAPDDATRPHENPVDPARLPDGVREGIELFNQRRFFEAHEVIEHEWHAERASIRRLYQGILQIGVGFYHALNGNQKGAVLLLTDGLAKTSEFTPDALGVRTGKLVAEAQRCLRVIERLGPDGIAAFDAGMIPRIEMVTIGANPAT
ncbi:MAG: DUF309 domain-containing protein [Thermomicrobiales bacterium]